VGEKTSGANSLTGVNPRLAYGWSRISRPLRWILVTLVLALVAGRLALPSIVKNYVNRQLNKSEEYGGSVGYIEIHLWRGAYSIHDLRILRRTGKTSSPFFTEPKLDLSIEWKEIFHGALVGEVALDRPQLNFEVGPTRSETQNGSEVRWDEILEKLFPFKLNRLQIDGGQVHFRNPHAAPPVDIFVEHLTATATNLTNSRDLTQALPAGVNARGVALGAGQFYFHLQLNPLAPAPTFELTTQLTNVNLVALNDFLKAYGKFDVERGKFSMFTSFAAKEGNFDGYLKVFFENLDVFEWEKERQKGALQVFWQAIVGTLTTIFKNQPNDRLATTIPITGSFQKTNVHIWPAVTTLLRNAFIRALVPKIDQKVTLQDVGTAQVDESKPSAAPRSRTNVLTDPKHSN